MNMKEFLKTQESDFDIYKSDLFDMLWERGGKQFTKDCDLKRGINGLIDTARLNSRKAGRSVTGREKIDEWSGYTFRDIINAQDFLDCVAIDEERVKQKIKELMK